MHRVKILNSLNQILEKSSGTRVFITGRPYIQAEIERCLAGRVTSVSVGPRKDDIIIYLRFRLDEDETPDAMDGSLEADILGEIPQKMSEMYVGVMSLGISPTLSANRHTSRFLLVALNVEAILNESTIRQRRERLGKLTDGLELGDVYGATIGRIKAQNGNKSRLGMRTLMWISHAERPLLADELRHALAVELGSMDFNADNVPSISTLVGCCQGLIAIEKEASTVRLIHFTLQEYLSARPDIFSKPHSAIAEICLTYLNSPQVRALRTAPSPDTQNMPFLEYCSVHWGTHAKRELSDCAMSLALNLLQQQYGQIPTKLLLAQIKHLYRGGFDIFSPFSGLHCASFFGIAEVVAGLIEMECCDTNERDFSGCTPLARAAYNGHAEVVEIILGREEISPDKPDNYGQAPLLLAARNGHQEVVEMLLAREEVNPDKPGITGRAPLSLAARAGHEGVVKILLGRLDVSPDKPDNNGQTPLSFAARDGREGVVKTLLGREEVNPDEPDYYGRTPLSFAASRGHEGVVIILLEREEVSPDKSDNYGRTPLSFAAKAGYEGVVKILLGREEVNPNKPDNYDRTPLSFAARHGHERAADILLGREDISPDKPDNKGQTPLSIAASYGHKRVVSLLQSHQEVVRGAI